MKLRRDTWFIYNIYNNRSDKEDSAKLKNIKDYREHDIYEPDIKIDYDYKPNDEEEEDIEEDVEEEEIDKKKFDVEKDATLQTILESKTVNRDKSRKIVTYLNCEIQSKDAEDNEKIRDFMCSNFYDIRTFGAVMTTFTKGALNCGQVRGPVQLGFARSIDPILPQEVTITRVAITTEADAEKKNTEMGRKYIVPYGLYRAEGYASANLARKTTGFSEEDLELLWTAILNMFENDHSAARGKMAVRELIVFKHNCELGCAPAHKLFDLVKVEHKDGVTAPRSYGDYTVSVDETHLPSGVTCTRMG